MDAKITKEYQGHTIEIDSVTMTFYVIGPLINDWFTEYHKAATKIDDAVKKTKIAARRKISLPVLDENGQKATVTGVHAGTGKILGINGGCFYPDVPWIVEALQRQWQLQDATQKIANRLQSVAMRTDAYYWSGTHSERIDQLIETIEKITKEAELMKKTETKTL